MVGAFGKAISDCWLSFDPIFQGLAERGSLKRICSAVARGLPAAYSGPAWRVGQASAPLRRETGKHSKTKSQHGKQKEMR